MRKKAFVLIIFILIIFGAAFYFFHSSKPVSVISGQLNTEKVALDNQKSAKSDSNSRPFFVSGWLPYWGKQQGADSLRGNLSLFSEINPFAFEVDSSGNIQDKLEIKDSPWPELIASAKKQNVNIVPTILWADAKAMHDVFSNASLLDNHINSIKTLLDKDNFSGVDIDYEGKNVADKDLFSNFIEKLHEALVPENKSLSCTIEARTQDNPPDGWNGTRAMSYANDYPILNKYCNTVKIMAYDETFQINGAKVSFNDSSETPSAPNADIQWDEKVIQYALQYINPEKIILGVPTYGWEFGFSKTDNGYNYTRIQSVSYLEAIKEARAAIATPARDSGGELSFVYKSSDGNHIVTFSDSEAIKQKIDLANKYNIKGISLFKLDGLFDPGLYSMLEKVLK